MIDMVNVLRSLSKGQSYKYHTGHLAFDRQWSYELDKTAKFLARASEAGTVVLVQTKAANGCNYLAVKV